MARITLVLPEPLHLKLKMTSRSEEYCLYALIPELLTETLACRNAIRLPGIYRGLWRLHWKGEPGIRDASVTIDEILYGQKEGGQADE